MGTLHRAVNFSRNARLAIAAAIGSIIGEQHSADVIDLVNRSAPGSPNTRPRGAVARQKRAARKLRNRARHVAVIRNKRKRRKA